MTSVPDGEPEPAYLRKSRRSATPKDERQPAGSKPDPIPKPKQTGEPAFKRGISAAALMEMDFDPVRFIVRDLIAEGATIFAGPPKIGKSWLVLDIALAVASGQPVFGSIPTMPGDVLYLALEDNLRRLKSRLRKKGIKQAPERLTLTTEWPNLDQDCIGELGEWADSVKLPMLVIIDVLRMVRGRKRKEETHYEADYRAIAPLAAFARARGIAVILVHHTRKTEADDPLESINGTNGLAGATDCAMVLKRDKGTGNFVLFVRGRDVAETEMVVRFDRDFATWEALGNVGEVGRTEGRQAIIDLLRKSRKPMSALEISAALNASRDATRKTLSRMVEVGELRKAGRGLYTLS